MSNIDKQTRDKLKSAAAKAVDNFDPNMFVETRDVLALLDELEAKEKQRAAANKVVIQQDIELQELRQRIAELEESHAQVIHSRDHYKRVADEGIQSLAEAGTLTVKLPEGKDSPQGWKVDPEFISKVQDAIGYDEECQCWEGTPSMEMVEAVLIAAADIQLKVEG
ncbi:hypothetical protein [Cronobacter universalis]|uniref:hypothetical protein n=1 Tax=Cronobacter universalis TaxID=535744 RepID=UPI003CF5E807